MSFFYFFIQTLLLKGLHKYSLGNYELFLDVKMENGVFYTYKKARNKTATHFRTQP